MQDVKDLGMGVGGMGKGHIWTPTGQAVVAWPVPVHGGSQENGFGAKGKKASRHTTPLLSAYWKVGAFWTEPGSE